MSNTGKNRKFKGFDLADKCLPGCYRKEARMKICEANGWSYPSTYDAKKRGDRPINEDEKKVMVEIFRNYGIDFETGQIIYFR